MQSITRSNLLYSLQALIATFFFVFSEKQKNKKNFPVLKYLSLTVCTAIIFFSISAVLFLQLVIKLFRQSRNGMLHKFWGKNYAKEIVVFVLFVMYVGQV